MGSVRSTEPRSVRLKGIPPPSKCRKYLIEGKGMLGDELIDFFLQVNVRLTGGESVYFIIRIGVFIKIPVLLYF